MRRPLAALLALTALPAATPASPDLAWLHGQWQGEGQLLGRAGTFSIKSGPVLAGTASAIDYVASIQAGDGKPAMRFEGRGTYRLSPDGKVRGQWSDSGGNFHPLAGQVRATSMHVTWGEPRTELGQSSYVLESDGTLTVTDSAIMQGEVRTFAAVRYRKTG